MRFELIIEHLKGDQVTKVSNVNIQIVLIWDM